MFEELRARARINAGDFDYWLEGTRHTAFCAAFSLALLRGRLAQRAHLLREQLAGLRETTRQLFSATFPAASVAEELEIRYAFHDAVLEAADGVAAVHIGRGSEPLSSAERLRRAYFHEEMDRPAVFSRTGFPAEDSSYDDLKAYLHAYSDLKRGWGASTAITSAGPPGEHLREAYSDDFDRVIDRIHAPGGVLEATALISLKGQPGLHESFFIKTRADVDTWLTLPMPSVGGPVDAFFESVRGLGDRGIVEICLGFNPAGTAAELMGSEQFAIASIDDRDLIHALCERRMREICALVRYLVEHKAGPFFSMLGEEYQSSLPRYLMIRYFVASKPSPTQTLTAFLPIFA